MSKIMLINVTHAEENRVGIVEDGQLESFEIESFSREHLKGNIYKGIIRRIHPAIEAAFVDIGAERDAFLPLDEICFRNLPAGRNGASSDKGRRRIKDVLKSGDEVLVQIIKEQFTNKPPTLSTFYSLPGRYLVLLPGSEDAGISRKIEGEERLRVREILAELHAPPGCGIIVRTAAGFDEDHGELERDLNYLQRLWESIQKHAESKRAPALIYREHDLVLRNIRDYFTPDINEIFIDNEDVYERARDFLHNVMPGKEHLLHLYQGEQPIFSRFGLEAQIESIYKRRVQLKSGGSIVIDGTEALTAIDVNSGGSMRGASQEDTAYKTNLEAAAEIARQLRLRDLGGIIVIDFIDMRLPSHVSDIERTLREAMRADKARHDLGRISRLGLLEVSRQRLRPAAAASSYTACPMCEGHGAIRTTESAALVALRKIHHRIAEGDVAQMKVSLPRDVALYLLNQKRDDLAVLEARYGARIQVLLSDKLMPHQSEIETRTREVGERLAPIVRPGEVAALDEALPANVDAGTRAPAIRSAARQAAGTPRRTAAPSGAGETGERGRRRRRRGGRNRHETPGDLPAQPMGADPPTGRVVESAAPESSVAIVDAIGAAPAASEPAWESPPSHEPAAVSPIPHEPFAWGGQWSDPRAAVADRESTHPPQANDPTEITPASSPFGEASAVPDVRQSLAATNPPFSATAEVREIARLEDVQQSSVIAARASAVAREPFDEAPATPASAAATEPGDVVAPTPSSLDDARRAPAAEAGSHPAADTFTPRRRRRRGGRRGGRGRRSAVHADALRASEPAAMAAAPDQPEENGFATGAEPGAADPDLASGERSGPPGHRRRGGARRRRTRGRHGPAPVIGPAEPPAES